MTHRKAPLPRAFRRFRDEPSEEEEEVSIAPVLLTKRELELERSQSMRERPLLRHLTDLPSVDDIRYNAKTARRIVRVDSIENLNARNKPGSRDIRDFYPLICGPLENLHLEVEQQCLLVYFIHPKHAYDFFNFFNIDPTAETAATRYKVKVTWITDSRRDIELDIVKAIVYEQASRCLKISNIPQVITEQVIQASIDDALDGEHKNVLNVHRTSSSSVVVEFHAISKAIKAKELLRASMVMDLEDTKVFYTTDICAVDNGEPKTVANFLGKWKATE